MVKKFNEFEGLAAKDFLNKVDSFKNPESYQQELTRVLEGLKGTNAGIRNFVDLGIKPNNFNAALELAVVLKNEMKFYGDNIQVSDPTIKEIIQESNNLIENFEKLSDALKEEQRLENTDSSTN